MMCNYLHKFARDCKGLYKL